jgi:hypothetical protein
MEKYTEYIGELKKGTVPPDYDRLYQKIEARLAPAKAGWPVKPLLSVALVAMLFILALPFIRQGNVPVPGDNELLAYVFQNDTAPAPDVVSYIFQD